MLNDRRPSPSRLRRATSSQRGEEPHPPKSLISIVNHEPVVTGTGAIEQHLGSSPLWGEVVRRSRDGEGFLSAATARRHAAELRPGHFKERSLRAGREKSGRGRWEPCLLMIFTGTVSRARRCSCLLAGTRGLPAVPQARPGLVGFSPDGAPYAADPAPPPSLDTRCAPSFP